MELIGEMHATETGRREYVTHSEIEHYFNMFVPSEVLNKPLAFWQRHEQSSPILSKVAQVYLGTSSSSVSGECIFSTTKPISNEKLDACIMWNAHNTVLGSKRLAICAAVQVSVSKDNKSPP